MRLKKQMNIFVSGEEGMISKTLIKQLKELGHTIANEDSKFDKFRTFDNYNYNSKFMFKQSNKQKEIDIKEFGLLEIFKSMKIDLIIHTAAFVNTSKCENDLEGAIDNNVKATFNLVHIAKTLNIAFVNFSTTAILNPATYNGLTLKLCEETEILPHTDYGITKGLAQQIVKWKLKKYLNFMPIFFVGEFPLDNSSELVKIIWHSIHDIPYTVTLSENNIKAYFWCEDACDAIIKIILNNESWKLENRDFCIGTQDSHVYSDYLEIIKKKLDLDKLPLTFLSDKDYLGNHISSCVKMKKYAIGWEQKVFAEEIVDRIIKSIKENEN